MPLLLVIKGLMAIAFVCVILCERNHSCWANPWLFFNPLKCESCTLGLQMACSYRRQTVETRNPTNPRSGERSYFL